MAIIQDIGGTLLEIDATPSAARVVTYNMDGTPKDPVQSYFISTIDIVPTTLTANTVYWSMRNTSLGSVKVYIRKLELKVGFNGVAAATRSSYEIIRFAAANPGGGTTQAPLKYDSTNSTPSQVGDIRFAPGGLTTTGIVFDSVGMHRIAHTNQLNIDHAQDIEFDSPFMLTMGEGLLIRAQSAIVAGSYLTGHIRWSER